MKPWICPTCGHTWSHHRQQVAVQGCPWAPGDARPCWGGDIECACVEPPP